MSHTNSTTNYSLPQFVTTDKPAWLTDINSAFSAIDTGMNNAQTKANTADTNASQALLDASAASAAASTADAKGAGAVASIADTFQTTETYAQDDLVMYNNLLYICIADVNTPGAWTGSTNWSRTTVETVIPTSAAELPYNSNTTTKAAIDAKADASALSPSSSTFPSSYVNTVVAYKSGNVASVNINSFSTLPTGGWTELFTLPSGYRAYAQYQVDCVGNDGRTIRFRFDTDGKCYAYNYGTAIASDNNSRYLITFIAG